MDFGRLTKGFAVTVLPRLAAAVGGVVVGKAAQKGLTLDPMEVQGVILAGYAGLHQLINSKVNPGGGAKLRLAEAEKEAVNTPGFTAVRVDGPK